MAAAAGLGHQLGGQSGQDAGLVFGVGGQQPGGALRLEAEHQPQAGQHVQAVQAQVVRGLAGGEGSGQVPVAGRAAAGSCPGSRRRGSWRAPARAPSTTLPAQRGRRLQRSDVGDAGQGTPSPSWCPGGPGGRERPTVRSAGPRCARRQRPGCPCRSPTARTAAGPGRSAPSAAADPGGPTPTPGPAGRRCSGSRRPSRRSPGCAPGWSRSTRPAGFACLTC